MRRLAIPFLALLAVTACAHDPYRYGGGPGAGPYGYYGDEWDDAQFSDPRRLDPWLEETREGRLIVERALGPDPDPAIFSQINLQFRQFADTDRDLRVTDWELRLALVRCATHGWSW